MKTKIYFYQKQNGETPVKDFLDSLTPKLQAKMVFSLQRLQADGYKLGMPYSAPLLKGIQELRACVRNDEIRITYIFHENKAVLLSGFVKKTEKTPAYEKDTAERYRNEYLKHQKEIEYA